MLTGGKSPRNAAEVNTFFARERRYQPIMDRHYESRGCQVLARDGKQAWDAMLCCGTDDFIDFVEEKFRNGIFHDVLIELLQDVCSGERGWFYHTECEHLHYVFCLNDVPQFYYRIWWPEFKRWFLEVWLPSKSFPASPVSKRGYGLTQNIAVPIADIPKDFIKRYETAEIKED